MTAVTGGDAPEQPETFAAFAQRIGKSRPYVSKLKAQGVFSAAAFAPDGRLIPSVALADMEANADPARGARGVPAHEASDATYARQRARKTAAEAERAELELRARKNELIERATIASTLAPWIRELRDAVLAVPRDVVLDPVVAADVEAALNAALAGFSSRLAAIAEMTSDGGAAAA